ncbi:MAG: zinc ribbon domain-containing protein [Candidatus Sumerlaeia bacterium]|nr:zinc ribbon domain-containing protein [Candidatus Sumerlaeia bacterium]
MPIFEYKCQKCNHIFEDLIRSEAEARAVVCPCCGSDQVKKLISRAIATGGDSMNFPDTSSSSSCSSCVSKNCASCK